MVQRPPNTQIRTTNTIGLWNVGAHKKSLSSFQIQKEN